MSRSYKKFPFVKCEKSCKKGKKWANKKVRNYLKSGKELPDGGAYQKVFCSWDICDYWCSYTWEEWLDHLIRWGYEIDKDTYYEWYRMYKRK